MVLEDVNELTKLVATAEANWEKNDILQGTFDSNFKTQLTLNVFLSSLVRITGL